MSTCKVLSFRFININFELIYHLHNLAQIIYSCFQQNFIKIVSSEGPKYVIFFHLVPMFINSHIKLSKNQYFVLPM